MLEPETLARYQVLPGDELTRVTNASSEVPLKLIPAPLVTVMPLAMEPSVIV